MAGDWLKWVKGLADKPEVVRMAAALNLNRDEVAGKLMRFWGWCDDNISEEGLEEDGTAVINLSPLDGDNLTCFIDQIVNQQGFAQSMIPVGWLIVRTSVIALPHFVRHNLATAKTRSRNALNQALQRKRKQSTDTVRPPTVQQKSSQNAEKALSPFAGDKIVTREEKRTEEKTEEKTTQSAGGFETFWNAYSLKKAKQEAKKAFQKLHPSPELLALMLASIERQKKEKAALLAAGDFCPQWPHAATWLNGRRWEDESATPRPQANGRPTSPPAETKAERDARVIESRRRDAELLAASRGRKEETS
jgi:hypothetical protein